MTIYFVITSAFIIHKASYQDDTRIKSSHSTSAYPGCIQPTANTKHAKEEKCMALNDKYKAKGVKGQSEDYLLETHAHHTSHDVLLLKNRSQMKPMCTLVDT